MLATWNERLALWRQTTRQTSKRFVSASRSNTHRKTYNILRAKSEQVISNLLDVFFGEITLQKNRKELDNVFKKLFNSAHLRSTIRCDTNLILVSFRRNWIIIVSTRTGEKTHLKRAEFGFSIHWTGKKQFYRKMYYWRCTIFTFLVCDCGINHFVRGWWTMELLKWILVNKKGCPTSLQLFFIGLYIFGNDVYQA